MSGGRGPGPEAVAAAALAGAVLAFFVPLWARGLTPFWGDLTYLHQAWRASPAMALQAGRAPLWEPSLYLGMPMAASQQGGLFYPLTQAFYFFGFATATALFEAVHLFLAGWLAALWLRSLRLSWGASAAGGLSFALGGLMVSRLPFLNHLAALSWAPALALLFRRRAALAGVLALMFLAGYPTFVPGACAAAWAVALALRTRRGPGPAAWAADWAAAGALALALSAVQLLPALELAGLSRRAGGVGPAEALTWGFTLADLRQWVSPLFVPLPAFRPEVDWWKCVYLGVAATGAGLLGLARLPRRRAAGLAAALAAVAVLILGGGNPVSRALWTHFAPLRFVRYPGNLAYLALLPLTALVGAGFAAERRGALLAVLMTAELLVFARVSTPVTGRALFTQAGPLARSLQSRLDGTRYLISPRALEASSGFGFTDWKTRLYGLTNAPYRLRAVANFGEPLVPAGSYAFMDRVLSARSVDEAASWMPWAGASRLLTPGPADSPRLEAEERSLWRVSRLKTPAALAYRMTADAGAALPEGIPESAPQTGAPLRVTRGREDRFSVEGDGAGWAFVAEPRYPGWTATLVTPGSAAVADPAPALGAFQKVAVPDGPWRLDFRYDPPSWRRGVLLTLLALLAFGSYWYHRASRLNHVP